MSKMRQLPGPHVSTVVVGALPFASRRCRTAAAGGLSHLRPAAQMDARPLAVGIRLRTLRRVLGFRGRLAVGNRQTPPPDETGYRIRFVGFLTAAAASVSNHATSHQPRRFSSRPLIHFTRTVASPNSIP